MKIHKFKLDEKHYKKYHRSLFDLRRFFYLPKCKICGEIDPFLNNHFSEKFNIPKIHYGH